MFFEDCGLETEDFFRLRNLPALPRRHATPIFGSARHATAHDLRHALTGRPTRSIRRAAGGRQPAAGGTRRPVLCRAVQTPALLAGRRTHAEHPSGRPDRLGQDVGVDPAAGKVRHRRHRGSRSFSRGSRHQGRPAHEADPLCRASPAGLSDRCPEPGRSGAYDARVEPVCRRARRRGGLGDRRDHLPGVADARLGSGQPVLGRQRGPLDRGHHALPEGGPGRGLPRGRASRPGVAAARNAARSWRPIPTSPSRLRCAASWSRARTTPRPC